VNIVLHVVAALVAIYAVVRAYRRGDRAWGWWALIGATIALVLGVVIAEL